MFKALRIFHIIKNCSAELKEKRTRLDVFCEQIIDSAIVAGITGISAGIATGGEFYWKPALIAFALTFLVKLKEYRGIK